MVLIGVGQQLFLTPVEERVDLEDTVIQIILFNSFEVAAGDTLLAAHAGYPPGQLLQCPRERFYLADAAAGVALLQRFTEGEYAFLGT